MLVEKPQTVAELIAMTGLTQAAIACFLGVREAAVSTALSGRSKSERIYTLIDELAGVEPGTTASLAFARATKRFTQIQAVIDARRAERQNQTHQEQEDAK